MAVTGPCTVLVLRALGLGDTLTAVPALRALRRWLPGRARVVLASPPGLAWLAYATGAVDEVLPQEGLAVPPAWHRPPPALAVNLHGSGPASIALLEQTRPGFLFTHAHPQHRHPGPPWAAGVHDVHRWCALLEHYGIPTDPLDLHLDPPADAPAVPGAIIVHPGAAYAARRWPADRYAAVMRALAGRFPDRPLVVLGGPGECELAAQLAELAPGAVHSVVSGTVTIAETAALVAGAALVICGDTGIAHLATAYRTPSVTLFGPCPPRLWGPLADRPLHRALWAGTEGDPHAGEVDPGLLRIRAGDVVAAASDLMEAAHA